MTTQGSHFTQVVREYEKSLDLLEAARGEYASAVAKTLDDLKSTARPRLAATSLPAGVRCGEAVRWSDKRRLAHESVYICLHTGDTVWTSVHAWVAKGYGGPCATLRVGVEVARHDDRFAWDRPWLEARMREVMTDLPWAQPDALAPDEHEARYWAWVANIDLLSPTCAREAADRLVDGVQAAGAIAIALARQAPHLG